MGEVCGRARGCGERVHHERGAQSHARVHAAAAARPGPAPGLRRQGRHDVCEAGDALLAGATELALGPQPLGEASPLCVDVPGLGGYPGDATRAAGRSDGQAVGLAVGRSIRRSAGRWPPFGRPVRRAAGRPDGQSVGRSVRRPGARAVGRPVGRSAGRPEGRSNAWSLGRPIGWAVSLPLGLSGDPSLGKHAIPKQTAKVASGLMGVQLDNHPQARTPEMVKHGVSDHTNLDMTSEDERSGIRHMPTV